MNYKEVVAELDKLDVSDPEHAHLKADELLLQLVSKEVRDTYERVSARASWWA